MNLSLSEIADNLSKGDMVFDAKHAVSTLSELA